MESDQEEQDFLDTADENGQVSKVFFQYNSVKDFLLRKERIFARAVALSPAEQHTFLKLKTDIDGCVVELKSLCAIDFHVRHLNIGPKGIKNLTFLKSLLKKHCDLSKFSKKELVNFNISVGFQLFYEHGWECWIGLIPTDKWHSRSNAQEEVKYKSMQIFQTFKTNVKLKLSELSSNNIATDTLKKNDLNDIGRMFVLPDDSNHVLSAIQDVLNNFRTDNFRMIVFCFRFGEKMSQGLSLSCFKPQHVKEITVHSAVNISSPDVNLMWSSGIQNLINNRGTLRTCLSFCDCSTFQSNLDGRSLDITSDLRNLCFYPDKIRFVQLYADIPHLKPKTRFHPVSGSIAGEKCFPVATAKAFYTDAQKYLSTLNNNWALMNNLECRLEFVTILPSVPLMVHATDCIDISQLCNLLENKAILVPFPQETVRAITNIGIWIAKSLTELLEKFKGTGNVEAIWTSYQLELASEKLLWGNPLCFRSNPYSINLGPGVLAPSRSASDALGFIALESWTSCMSLDDDIPPCNIWSSSEVIQKRIARFCGIHDHIKGSYHVIGRRLLHILIQDLFEAGKVNTYFTFELFLGELTAKKTRFQVTGTITIKQLINSLTTQRKAIYPMVFGSLRNMVEQNRIDFKTVLEAGFNELKLTHFPAIQLYDNSRNAVLNWNMKSNFWRIIDNLDNTTTEKSAEIFSTFIIGELDRRGLVWASKLKGLPKILPWVSICLKKLVREKLNQDDKLSILTYISCIAFIMQGWYVEFDRLFTLLKELAVNQNKLKELEILSKFQLKTFNATSLYRLHWSIPHTVSQTDKKEASSSASNTTDEKELEQEDMISPSNKNHITDDDLTEIQIVESRSVSCLPIVQCRGRWSGKELELLNDLSESRNGRSASTMYEIFKQKCVLNNIPFRTFRAFENRFNRVQN